jgi:predicted DNA-binding transcriptional regulator YafY
VAFDLDRDDWRTFRVDRIDGPDEGGGSAPLGAALQPGARFSPRPAPADDLVAYVGDRITSAPYQYRATVLFHAPIDAVAERSSPSAGRLEARGPDACLFHAGAASLDEIALYVALKGFEFEVVDPPELVDRIRVLASRLDRAGKRLGSLP